MPPVGLDCFQSNQECLKHHFNAGLHVLRDAICHFHGLEKLHQHPLREMEIPHTFIQSDHQDDQRILLQV